MSLDDLGVLEQGWTRYPLGEVDICDRFSIHVEVNDFIALFLAHRVIYLHDTLDNRLRPEVILQDWSFPSYVEFQDIHPDQYWDLYFFCHKYGFYHGVLYWGIQQRQALPYIGTLNCLDLDVVIALSDTILLFDNPLFYNQHSTPVMFQPLMSWESEGGALTPAD